MDLSELDRLEKQVETIKLSDRLRAGLKLRGQCRYAMSDGRRTCALGAIYETTFGTLPDISPTAGIAQLNSLYPQLLTQIYDEAIGAKSTLAQSIAFRNDSQRWSREQIATWLAEQGL